MYRCACQVERNSYATCPEVVNVVAEIINDVNYNNFYTNSMDFLEATKNDLRRIFADYLSAYNRLHQCQRNGSEYLRWIDREKKRKKLL